MKKAKYISVGFIAGAIFFSGISYAATNVVQFEAVTGIKLIHNGIDKTPKDKPPFVVDGTTYVPLRTAAELTGVDVSWDGKKKSVIIGKHIEGVALPSPASIVKSDNSVEVSITENANMRVNEESYGNVGQILHTDGYDSQSATFSYNLNALYKSLTLGYGIDDQTDKNNTKRSLTFKDQDGKVLHQAVLGIGSIQEGIVIDVEGVTRLDIEIGDIDIYDVFVDLISPTLQK